MIKGILITMLLNSQSKSEGLYPLLYMGGGRFANVILQDDFLPQASALLAYDGKFLALEGSYDEENVFIAESFAEIPPFPLTEEEAVPVAGICTLSEEVTASAADACKTVPEDA
jgi:hypothetical protein